MPEPKNESTHSESLPSSPFWDIIRYVIVAVIAGGLIWYYGFYTPPTYSDQEVAGQAVGTAYIIKVPQFPDTDNWENLRSGIQNLFSGLEQKLSTQQQDSEICRFNAFSSTDDWFPVSPETAQIVQTALEISQQTSGVFDITLLPLVRHWELNIVDDLDTDEAASLEQTSNKSYEEWKAESVSLKEQIGFEKLSVRLDPPALKKSIPDLEIDLSLLVKGFAADCIAEMLDQKKIADYFIVVGQDVRCKGIKSKDKPWNVAVENPTQKYTGNWQTLKRIDGSFAVKENYLRPLRRGGQRIVPFIDPRTGFPAAADQITDVQGVGEILSVSVLAPTCTASDALATALFILGEREGLAFAEKRGVPVLFLIRDGKEICAAPSTMWAKKSMNE